MSSVNNYGLASFLLNRYLYDEPDYSSSSNSSDERNKFDYHKLINNIETDDESSSYSESAAEVAVEPAVAIKVEKRKRSSSPAQENTLKKVKIEPGVLSRGSEYTIGYHRRVVEQSLGKLPCVSVTQLVALNAALEDEKIAVSLVLTMMEDLKDFSRYSSSLTLRQLTRSVYQKLISHETSHYLQWKERSSSDRRQGMSHLSALLSTIGASVLLMAKEKKIDFSITEFIKLLKSLRSANSSVYRKEGSIPWVEVDKQIKNSLPVSSPSTNVAAYRMLADLDKQTNKLAATVEKIKISSA